MMIDNDFNSILELISRFKNQMACIKYLEGCRWGNNIVSPFDIDSKVWRCKDVLNRESKFVNRRYRCKNTSKYFNVFKGTLFENTKVPLQKWFLAIWLLTSHRKGISSLQLRRDLRVTQKSTWFMSHRIRECLQLDDKEVLRNTVEVDEAYIGGKNQNRHKSKRLTKFMKHHLAKKSAVIGMLERNGKVIAFPVDDVGVCTLRENISLFVFPLSTVYTDNYQGYRGLGSTYNHKVIEHNKGMYVIGDIHTNTIEGFWSLLKRMLFGTHHWTSKKHLHRYINEMVYRYNSRDVTEGERFNMMLLDMEHRTKYKDLAA